MTIKKISQINELAVFKNFDWDKIVRDSWNNINEFKRLNLLYWRNYSWKTTLSRIFWFIENKEIHSKYNSCKFNIKVESETDINESNIWNNNLEVRVYNTDFVKNNLNFLINEDAWIEPFAILWDKNVEIEKKIDDIEIIIKWSDHFTWIELLSNIIYSKYESINTEISTKNNSIDSKLRDKAISDIKANHNVYWDINYNIIKLKSDIWELKKNPRVLLTETEIDDKKALIKEESKNSINILSYWENDYQDIIDLSNGLISKKITPSVILKELIEDDSLQSWVKNWIWLHKWKKDKCAFCWNDLDKDLWSKLDNHFNKESEDLETQIKLQIEVLEWQKIDIKNILKINKNNFYSSYHIEYEEVYKKLDDEIKKFNSNFDKFIKKLNDRLKNIFKDDVICSFTDNSEDIKKCINELNGIINKHNEKTNTLKEEQDWFKNDLRLNEISKFIDYISYYEELDKISLLSSKRDNLKNYNIYLKEQIKSKNDEIDLLKSELKDEKKWAEKVNQYLKHYFWNEHLELSVLEDEDEQNIKFLITRNSEPAFNLSEGECSLISFCYFIAKLEEQRSKDKDLIIWIDDPISSLDNNHIFFIFSLIENIIAKPKKYKQLFISTHNLDFFKYLKRLTIPNKSEWGINHFIIEKINKDESEIRCMPNYLKEYITEFNYLFEQIYKCANLDITSDDYDFSYNFGNNLRKFLEAYLFYKYPSNESETIKLNNFFDDDKTSTTISTRISNELSHLRDIFDRSMKPIDVAESKKLAQYVLDKIKEKDPEQYEALIKSIN